MMICDCNGCCKAAPLHLVYSNECELYLCQFFCQTWNSRYGNGNSLQFFFFFFFKNFECPEVSKFSCVKREEMKGFLIDSYRKSLLSQGILRPQIRHRCLQNVTYPEKDKWTSSELDIWLRFKRPGFSSVFSWANCLVSVLWYLIC